MIHMKKNKAIVVFIATMTLLLSSVVGFNSMFSQAKRVAYGQSNALQQAQNYLNFAPFSKKGLIKQLKFEGYSDNEAKYAVKNCGANWKDQAERKAIDYLNTAPFSKSGLIKQLKFEGFTAKQAEYGVKNCGANWKKQAVKKGKQYLDSMPFSKSRLISQLKYEGFTKKQVNYAIKKIY